MKILITGANGFTGRHLRAHLASSELFCVDIQDCDLTNLSQTGELIQRVKPQQIYHLAGSFTNDYATDYLNNVVTSKNLLDSLLQFQPSCRLLLIGSAAEYGIPKKNPVSEEAPLNPTSVYGLTKAFQTQLMQFYVSHLGLDVVMARTFNLLGKGISNRLFVGRVYEQIEQLKKGTISKITLGDLSSQRDYIEVERAVQYYEKIMKCAPRGEIYNVGSSKSLKISDLLQAVLREHNLDLSSVVEKKGAQSLVSEIYSDTRKLLAL